MGWTPRQLEAELEAGAWYIFAGDAGMVFAAKPESVWPRIIREDGAATGAADLDSVEPQMNANQRRYSGYFIHFR
jgi:putative transcriptional regulator